MTDMTAFPPILKKVRPRTLTVGAEGSDVFGFDGKTIQLAVDALRPTGGRVVLSAGVFSLSAPIRLYDGVELCGDAAGTTLQKKAAFSSPLSRDADYGELVVSVADASGFSVGDGVVVYDTPNAGAWGPTVSVIEDIRGQTLYLRDDLQRDYNATEGGKVSNASSLVEGVGVRDVCVKNLLLDATAAGAEPLSGCRGGGVYFYKSRDVRIENVTVRGFGGDGISVQTMENVVIDACRVYECTHNGIHPGAGSYGVRVENCISSDNGGDGLYVCWRVIGGEFKNNRLLSNRQSGINIGHKDTDNLFLGNICHENDKYGLHLRPEREDNAPHRCVYRNNDFTDNRGGTVKIESPAKDLIFEKNKGY